MNMMNKLMAGVLGLFVMVSAAFSADMTWTNTAVSSGDFNTPANWSSAFASTNKINWFGYTGLNIYKVTLNLSGNASIGGWDQDYWNNEVNVNLNGFTLDQSGAGDPEWGVWTYGASSIGVTNRIYGGGKLNAMALRVGGAGATATSPLFEIYGAGTRVTTGTGAGYFGNNTRAFIRDGAVLSNDTSWASIIIGQGGSSSTDPKNSVFTLTDSPSRWDNTGLLVVGYVKGDGTLIVTNGAVYKGGGNVNLGGWQYLYNPIEDYKNKGTIRVTGAGSTFETLGRTDVGLLSTGVVEVVSGGYFKAAEVRLGVGYSDWKPPNVSNFDGTNTYAFGRLALSGSGSVAEISSLKVGDKGTGEVIVADNADLAVAGAIELRNSKLTVSDALAETGGGDLTTAGSCILRFELGARDHTLSYLSLGGSLTLGEIKSDDTQLEVDVLGNFSAVLSDKIALISYGSHLREFSNYADQADITAGVYTFKITYDTAETFLTVTAIPEPGTMSLFGLATALAALLRRRLAA